jgi:hypothetical protein
LEHVVIFFIWQLYHQKITPVLCRISGFCCNINELHSSGMLPSVEWKFLPDILEQPISFNYKGEVFIFYFSMLRNIPEEADLNPDTQ